MTRLCTTSTPDRQPPHYLASLSPNMSITPQQEAQSPTDHTTPDPAVGSRGLYRVPVASLQRPVTVQMDQDTPVVEPYEPEPRPTMTQRFQSILALFQISPFTIAFFVVLIAICNELSTQREDINEPSAAVEAVWDCYGSGMFYGWIANGLAAVCQSKPDRPRDNLDNERIKAIRVYRLITTFGVAIYAWGAAGHELYQIITHQPYSPSRAAPDRVCQVAWIFATQYLLHHAFSGGLRHKRRPSAQTVTWILVWLATSAATAADRVERHMLPEFTYKVVIPFIIGILSPQFVVYLLEYKGVISWSETYPGWQVAVLNSSTVIISLTYAAMPREWRYDPDSPAAPLSAHTLRDPEQILAFAIGLTVALPLLLAIWKRGKRWVKVTGRKVFRILSNL